MNNHNKHQFSISQLLNGEGNPVDCFSDWLCLDKALKNRAITLMRRVRAISRSKKFDNDKCYLLFDNTSGYRGKLFDTFRICDMETGEVIYTVVPCSGFSDSRGNALVYGIDNDFESALVDGTWSEAKEWFLN